MVIAVSPDYHDLVVQGPERHRAARVLANKFIAVHPTVTLSIVDHYTRVAKDTSKRVVGVLLGETIDGKTHATNSFAVPFEEDLKDASLWFLDHNYLESMAYMFLKISKKEKIVGWYSTGNRIKPVDLEVNELLRAYTPHPIYVLVNVKQQSSTDQDLPFHAYMSYDEPCSDKLFRRTFAHISCGVAQFEAEEVAVEHLLRDLECLSSSTRALQVLDRLNGLKCLQQKLEEVGAYLKDVSEEKLSLNPRILTNVQNIFNLSPNTNDPELIDALETQINSSMLTIYTGSVVRTVLALHDLVKNRLNLNDQKTKEKTPEKTSVTTQSAAAVTGTLNS